NDEVRIKSDEAGWGSCEAGRSKTQYEHSEARSERQDSWHGYKFGDWKQQLARATELDVRVGRFDWSDLVALYRTEVGGEGSSAVAGGGGGGGGGGGEGFSDAPVMEKSGSVEVTINSGGIVYFALFQQKMLDAGPQRGDFEHKETEEEGRNGAIEEKLGPQIPPQDTLQSKDNRGVEKAGKEWLGREGQGLEHQPQLAAACIKFAGSRIVVQSERFGAELAMHLGIATPQVRVVHRGNHGRSSTHSSPVLCSATNTNSSSSNTGNTGRRRATVAGTCSMASLGGSGACSDNDDRFTMDKENQQRGFPGQVDVCGRGHDPCLSAHELAVKQSQEWEEVVLAVERLREREVEARGEGGRSGRGEEVDGRDGGAEEGGSVVERKESGGKEEASVVEEFLEALQLSRCFLFMGDKNQEEQGNQVTQLPAGQEVEHVRVRQEVVVIDSSICRRVPPGLAEQDREAIPRLVQLLLHDPCFAAHTLFHASFGALGEQQKQDKLSILGERDKQDKLHVLGSLGDEVGAREAVEEMGRVQRTLAALHSRLDDMLRAFLAFVTSVPALDGPGEGGRGREGRRGGENGQSGRLGERVRSGEFEAAAGGWESGESEGRMGYGGVNNKGCDGGNSGGFGGIGDSSDSRIGGGAGSDLKCGGDSCSGRRGPATRRSSPSISCRTAHMAASRLDFGSVGGERENDSKRDGSSGASGDDGVTGSGDGSGGGCGSIGGGAAKEPEIITAAQRITDVAEETSAGQGTGLFPPPLSFTSTAPSSHLPLPPPVLSPVPEAEDPISPDSVPPSATTAIVRRTTSSPSPSTSSSIPTSSFSHDDSSIAPADASRTLYLPSLRPLANSAAEDPLEEPFNAPAPDLPSPVTPSPHTTGSHSTALWSPHTPRDFESSLNSSPQAAPLSPRAPPSAETSPCKGSPCNGSPSNESPSKASPSTPPSNRFPRCERFLSAVNSHPSSSFPPSPSEESYSQHVMRRISPPPVMPPSAAGPAKSAVKAAAWRASLGGLPSRLSMKIRGVRKSAQGDEELREQVQRWDGMMREEAGRICKAAAVPFVTGFMEASGGGGAHSLVDAYELKVRLHHLLERWGLVQDSMATERPSLVLPHLYLGSAIAARSFPLLHHLSVRHVVTLCPTDLLDPDAEQSPLFNYLVLPSLELVFPNIPSCPSRHVSKCAPHLALLALLSSPFSTMRDSDREDLSKYIDTTSSFLEAAISKGEGVLVHCYEGRSRSVSIVLAYLMTKSRPSRGTSEGAGTLPAQPNPTPWPHLHCSSDREDLSKYIDTTSSFLEAAISKGEGVLAHAPGGGMGGVAVHAPGGGMGGATYCPPPWRPQHRLPPPARGPRQTALPPPTLLRLPFPFSLFLSPYHLFSLTLLPLWPPPGAPCLLPPPLVPHSPPVLSPQAHAPGGGMGGAAFRPPPCRPQHRLPPPARGPRQTALPPSPSSISASSSPSSHRCPNSSL
ncbi:unnamed protein product, partial [Closterium sp. NIES-65]